MPNRTAAPSRRVTRRHHAEELNWWAASGWELAIKDGEDGSLHLHAVKHKARGSAQLWSARASAEQVATPELTRQFLTEALYLHVHPRKAMAAHQATGRVCTEAGLVSFIRRQRRFALNRRFIHPNSPLSAGSARPRTGG